MCGVHAQLLSCARLCDPLDSSLPGSSVRRISHGRILEWKKEKKEGYWSGLLFPSPGDVPITGIKSVSPESPAIF